MTCETTTSRFVLVRHTEIAERYRGVCYGSSDVELGPAGFARGREVATALSALPIARIVHSGLARTRFLAERLGELTNLEPVACAGLRERDFGSWELQPWTSLFAQHGSEMERMISEPESYRPGGGETTFEMRDRIVSSIRSLPRDGLTVVVTHGGPIAVWRGVERNAPVADWLALIPAYGEIVEVGNVI